jgi:hypothetical protein
MSQLTTTKPQPSFNKYLNDLKDAEEDFEWYSTTQPILDKLGERLKELKDDSDFNSILDVGAGNGKVLKYIESLDLFHNYFAIEKSNFHLSNLPPNFRVLGVDFWANTLMDKEISCAFTNPPFSQFGPWIAKILKELSRSSYIFFVAPDRWANNEDIKEALRVRGGEIKVLGQFSFEDSEDRKARANVELVEISPSDESSRYYKDDPFVRFFEENFKYPEPKEDINQGFDEKVDQNKLVTGQNLIEVLCDLYEDRMNELHRNYKAVCSLPHEFLKEFEIKKEDLLKSLKDKLASAKKEYWGRLFRGMNKINRTLTTESQKEVLGMMNAQAGIDFNRDNCYALIQWIIKNANVFYDRQLVQVYKKMLEYVNVDNYVSNKRVFSQNQFRYNWYREETNEVTHVKLKVGHRMVLARCGGLSNSSYSWEKGLNESAANFIRDLLVIANNLGFEYIGNPPQKGEWDTSEQVEYLYKDKEEWTVTLFTVRCFLNQNIHLKCNPKFINALNIQAGKLLKWIGSDQEASEEMGVDIDMATKFFNHCFRIGEQQILLN